MWFFNVTWHDEAVYSSILVDEVLEFAQLRFVDEVPVRPLGHVGEQRAVVETEQR